MTALTRRFEPRKVAYLEVAAVPHEMVASHRTRPSSLDRVGR